MPKKKIKVLMAAVECFPFAKVGGLADVVGSLPPALKKAGVDIRLILPLYGFIGKSKYSLKKIYSDLEVPSGRVMLKVNIWQGILPGTSVKVYFIDAPEYFKFKEVYVKGDNSERFLFFSLASLYALPVIKFIPDIIHCQDSHVALIADILKTTNLQFLQNIKTLFTIHNFNYQGKTEVEVLATGNLNTESLKTLSIDARDGDINFMAQGVLNADLVNTVSPAYAKEITTSFYGAGLDNVVRKRKRDLSGIINGLDVDYFNPSKDEHIFKKYSAKTLNNKIVNKVDLQKKLGLSIDKNVALVGIVTRLVWQKGLDLLTKKLNWLNCQFVVLGAGQKKYEQHLLALEKKHPQKFSINIGFDLFLAQQIYAGSDIFLMPSRFEPCGLGQMIAMRYGAVPVVRSTGGLADTVDEKTGFSFKKLTEEDLFKTLGSALDMYYQEPKKWQAMQKRGMKKDFSWQKPAKDYLKLYKKLLKINMDK